jgi:hypothetical protein
MKLLLQVPPPPPEGLHRLVVIDPSDLIVLDVYEPDAPWWEKPELQINSIVQGVVRQLREEPLRPSPWTSKSGLADYTGWGLGTIDKLSASKLIPGLVKHGGKVMIHLPTFDAGLLQDHQVGPRLLPDSRSQTTRRYRDVSAGPLGWS